jgi:hypothetical protein
MQKIRYRFLIALTAFVVLLTDFWNFDFKKSNKNYERAHFSSSWGDFDKDCQNTRAEVLVKTSLVNVSFHGNTNCRVKNGMWVSLFTGEKHYKASNLDIDHIVPLKWAWEHGASSWTKLERKRFYNDLDNLIPVEKKLNSQKGAYGPEKWLPPRSKCDYVKKFIHIMKKYHMRSSFDYFYVKKKVCG